MKLAVVVLAAGLGKRMRSSLPKVLHNLHGNSMVRHVVSTMHELKPQKIVVVVGENFEEIGRSVKDTRAVFFARQKVAKGTGDALLTALPELRGFEGTIVVVNGDTPLINPDTLKRFLALHAKKRDDISVLSFVSADPGAYGRVLRDHKGGVLSVIENRDATESQKMIKEVNSGIYALEPRALRLLREIKLNKSKGEYYLTDIVGIARDEGMRMNAFCIGSEDEFMGINTREELERARSLMRVRILRKWVNKGVSFMEIGSVFISADTLIGKDTVVYPNVHLEGSTRIGRRCVIFPNVRIHDSLVGDDAVIKDSTLIEESVIRPGASVGPFAHIRPGSLIGAGAKIGNFVEVKKSVIGPGTKASHLSYLGDARIGKNVNIGAGTITCNYDGYRKNVTTIGDDAFIGSDSQLIAPVKVGRGAYVGAGATITKDVPSKALALSRAEQTNIKGWVVRRKLKAESSKSEVKSSKSKN